ncbi:MAG: hypothetical protein GC147_11470 [Porphyrobacter sp.]|nr:hypothetical protein [Porphyrobacter sp.]
MKLISLVAAGALALCAAAPVAAQDYVAERVVPSVKNPELAAVVGALGHQVLEEGEGDEVLVLAENADQLRYVLIGTACEMQGVSGCQGVMMQVQVELPPGTTYETVAAANLNYAAISVWVDFEQKSLGFTRYVVLDNGVTMANIRANVEVLLSLVAEAYPVAAGETPIAPETSGA